MVLVFYQVEQVVVGRTLLAVYIRRGTLHGDNAPKELFNLLHTRAVYAWQLAQAVEAQILFTWREDGAAHGAVAWQNEVYEVRYPFHSCRILLFAEFLQAQSRAMLQSV